MYSLFVFLVFECFYSGSVGVLYFENLLPRCDSDGDYLHLGYNCQCTDVKISIIDPEKKKKKLLCHSIFKFFSKVFH